MSYGYLNERSEEQLEMLKQELEQIDKSHLLRVRFTRGNLDTKKHGPNSIMIRTIIAVNAFFDYEWEKLESFVFDDRYDGGVVDPEELRKYYALVAQLPTATHTPQHAQEEVRAPAAPGAG